MAVGTITSLMSGFGFILRAGANPTEVKLFFQRGDVQGTSYAELRVGQQVEYDLGWDERQGTAKANNVRAINSDGKQA